jgi:cephalosporin-C deacetylase
MADFVHAFPFDPTYGYTLETLRAVGAPEEPEYFESFWRSKYARALQVQPSPRLSASRHSHPQFHVHDIRYRSTDGFDISGWLLTPREGDVVRGLVIGHGYGGRDCPDFDLPIRDAAVIFPCFRGLSRSRCPGISDNPAFHVLHDIDRPDRYILGGCVEDLWLAVSTLLGLFPKIEGRIGYMGVSFGGGIGAMALAFDGRIRRAHLNVPTFGHQPIRLILPTSGSGEAVRTFEKAHGHTMVTLRYYDAALAARHISIPVHLAAALFDPVVAPPGQFAIYNALRCPKELFVLDAGHFEYPDRIEQERRLLESLEHFFASL